MCVALTMGKTRYTDPGEYVEAEAALAPASTARFGADEPLVVGLCPLRNNLRHLRVRADDDDVISVLDR